MPRTAFGYARARCFCRIGLTLFISAVYSVVSALATTPPPVYVDVIAMTGDPWPELGPGTTYSSSYYVKLNNRGDIAAYLEFLPDGPPGSRNHSLWTISPAGQRRLFVADDMVTDDGYRIGFDPHDTEPVLGSGGHFYAADVLLTRPDGSQRRSEFVRPSATGGLIARPTVENSPFYPPINVHGEMAYSNSNGDAASIWSADGSVRPLLDAAAPDTADGRQITGIEVLSYSDRRIAYFTGAAPDQTRVVGGGLWAVDATAGTLAAALIEPYTPLSRSGFSGRIAGLESYGAVSENGHVFTIATLAPGTGVTDDNNTVLVLRKPNNDLETIAWENDPVTGASQRLRSFGGMQVNDAGDLAFAAQIEASIFSPREQAIFARPNDRSSYRTIAKSGNRIPNWFGEFEDLSGPALNARGQIAFTNTPAGAQSGNASLWVWEPDNTYHPILRAGDLVELAPGDVRRALGVLHWSFNDLGQVAFGVQFEDGTSALVISNAVAVPEPTGIGIAIGALLFGLIAKSRQKRGATAKIARRKANAGVAVA